MDGLSADSVHGVSLSITGKYDLDVQILKGEFITEDMPSKR